MHVVNVTILFHREVGACVDLQDIQNIFRRLCSLFTSLPFSKPTTALGSPKYQEVPCILVYTFAVVLLRVWTVAWLSILSAPEVSWLGYK